MKKLLIKIAAIALMTAVVTGTVQAQDKKEKPAASADAKKPARGGMPFHGKLSAVDTTAKTISIKGKEKDRTFQITSKTKIMKDSKPAMLEDAKVGDEVGGFARETDGKMEVVTLRVGPKPEGKAPKKDEKK